MIYHDNKDNHDEHNHEDNHQNYKDFVVTYIWTLQELGLIQVKEEGWTVFSKG